MFQYEAIVAKCRCMSSQLLTKQQYLELCHKKSVAEAATYLKDKTDYSRLLEDIDISRIHRGQLEYIFQKDLFEVYVKLYNFASGSDRKFIGYLIQEFEIHYLLNAIRSTKTKLDTEFYSIPLFLSTHSQINFNKLFVCNTISEVMDIISNTKYYGVIKPYISSGSEIDFTSIETALYNNYYKNLYYKHSLIFDKENSDIIQNILKTKADIMNISRIIRLKRFSLYDEGNSEIDITSVLPYLIPIRGKLKEKDIENMLAFDDISTLIQYCDDSYFTAHQDFSKYDVNFEYSTLLLFNYYRKLLANSKPSFCVPFGLLSLKEFEIKNLVYIIEGIRYSVTPLQIEKHIVSK